MRVQFFVLLIGVCYATDLLSGIQGDYMTFLSSVYNNRQKQNATGKLRQIMESAIASSMGMDYYDRSMYILKLKLILLNRVLDQNPPNKLWLDIKLESRTKNGWIWNINLMPPLSANGPWDDFGVKLLNFEYDPIDRFDNHVEEIIVSFYNDLIGFNHKDTSTPKHAWKIN